MLSFIKFTTQKYMKVCFVLHKHGSNKMCIKMGVFNAFHEYE